MKSQSHLCPCGSRQPLSDCCGPLLAGYTQASTAEQLMRSRYSAYALGDRDYLERTWHPSTRPGRLSLDTPSQPRWCGLTVMTAVGGMPEDAEGMVEFVARYRVGDEAGQLHERSRFVQEHGHWYYVDGTTGDAVSPGAPTPARNAPCPCGSGKKYKRCCGK